MARQPFGLTLEAWSFVSGAGNVATLIAAATITFWNQVSGGSQITDLALDAAGMTPVTFVTSSDGTDGNTLGQIPTVYGPDSMTSMYASANNGPRILITARNAADNALAALNGVTSNANALSAHAQASNPHGTQIADLNDVLLPAPASRVDQTVLTWDASSLEFKLVAAAAVSGALLLNPPNVGGSYVGNTATEPPPANGASGQPWLSVQRSYSSGDTNPDLLQFFSTASNLATKIKTFWLNGNNEVRSAPSTSNRIGARFFESYESQGLSTDLFAMFSTNPTNTANREPLLGVYGSASTTKPGWAEATRVLSGMQGVAIGGNFGGLSQMIMRGRKTTTGAPTTGTWSTGDALVDSAGALWLCTAGGTPGTWSSSTGGGGGASAPSSFIDITPGTGMGQATKHAASRLERGGDAARLRGQLTATAGIASGAVFANIPTAAHQPDTQVSMIVRTTAGGGLLTIAINGDISVNQAFSTGQSIWLDGITYDLL